MIVIDRVVLFMGSANGYHNNIDKQIFIHTIPATRLGGDDSKGGGGVSNGEGDSSSLLSCLCGSARVDTCGVRACWQLAGV